MIYQIEGWLLFEMFISCILVGMLVEWIIIRKLIDEK